ncbi:MAG: CBS domain-containing protein [Planctomycetes bacterium]|nr:CBS domain-containing protein [Planctomycetota bacterium]
MENAGTSGEERGKSNTMDEELVRDIMVPLEEYPCIPETHTLRQAIEAMGRSQISRNRQASLPRTALVFDESLTDLLGMLRRRDIMRGLEPRFLLGGALEYRRKLFEVDIDPNLAELSSDKMIAGLRRRAERRARDFMIPIRATIDFDDHIMKAISEMVDQNTSLLPVIQQRRAVGVVRSVDVLNRIARLLGITECP